MNRNQKIALGCGGGGCLGLILIVILVLVLIFTGFIKAPGITSYFETNSNSNRNSNYNRPYNRNTNTNSSTLPSSSSTMSDDDKHKLFQAAAGTRDTAVTRRVSEKLGLLKADGSPTDQYAEFFKDHIGWIFRNSEFMKSINTPEKARAYVDEHIDD